MPAAGITMSRSDNSNSLLLLTLRIKSPVAPSEGLLQRASCLPKTVGRFPGHISNRRYCNLFLNTTWSIPSNMAPKWHHLCLYSGITMMPNQTYRANRRHPHQEQPVRLPGTQAQILLYRRVFLCLLSPLLRTESLPHLVSLQPI